MDWDKYSTKKINTKNVKKDFPFSFFESSGPGILLGLLLLIVVVGAMSSFYRVYTQERAVITRFGKYLKTSEPGLHFKLPFGVDQVFKEETTVIQEETFGFISSERGEAPRRTISSFYSDFQKTRNTDAESLMLTGDLNVADVEWVVHYRISDLRAYLFNVRNPRKNIRDVSEAVMRRVVGDMTVQDVITSGRVAISSEAKLLTQQILDQYEMGIEVVDIKLQDVNPPEKVKPAFNEVNSAKQEQEQAINLAEAERNKIIPETKGKADQEISKAEGYALQVVNRARGDAEKFEQILIEYEKAPQITRTRLYLDLMATLLRRTEGVTIIDPEITGVLPIYTADGTPLNKTRPAGKEQ